MLQTALHFAYEQLVIGMYTHVPGSYLVKFLLQIEFYKMLLILNLPFM